MLKILIIGLGSIGRKHLSCLKEMPNVKITALRTSKGTLKEYSEVEEIYDIKMALAGKFNGVIISNPTSLHVETALSFLSLGVPVLIEKPISDQLYSSFALNDYSNLMRVAYCMRFHPLNALIKDIIDKERIFKIGFRRSYYLPYWHPYANYKNEYTARKELGGGGIRTLSHEIDLMVHWFGIPESCTGVVDKVSNLEINTDDYAFFTCKYEQGVRVNFELDFLSPTNINTGEMYTENGRYNWDMTQVWFTDYSNRQQTVIAEFGDDAIDIMYIDQIKDFIGFVKTKSSMNATLLEAQETLKIIEKIDD